MSSKLAVSIILYFFSYSSITAQDCNSGLSSGSWNGSTQKGVGNTYGSKSVQVTYENSTLSISDFTAGYMSKLGHNENYSVLLSIDCNGGLKSKNVQSKFGSIKVSGRWDESRKRIIINWDVSGSGLIEQTILTL